MIATLKLPHDGGGPRAVLHCLTRREAEAGEFVAYPESRCDISLGNAKSSSSSSVLPMAHTSVYADLQSYHDFS